MRDKAIIHNSESTLSRLLKGRTHKGFTLLELTIVTSVFLVIGTIIVTLLNSTFRGNNKVRVSNDVAQNGNYALNIISNLLINSQKFESITSDATVSTVCSPAITGEAITVRGFDNGMTTLTCEDSGTISSKSAALVDNAPVVTSSLLDISQVALVADSCSFTCTQSDEYSAPRIDVVFTLKNASADTAENTASSIFRTSISLRNQDLK